MIAVLRNKRASTPIFTAIMVLVFAMIISAVMYVAYVQIQTTNIRNAMKTGLLKGYEDFSNSSLGNFNAAIINNMIVNVIENSYGKDYIAMDEECFENLKEAKKENYEKIYCSKEVSTVQKQMIEPMFEDLYKKLKQDLETQNTSSPIFSQHIDFINNSRKYYCTVDYRETDETQIVIDYIASMTDDYLVELYDYFYPGKNKIKYFAYFDNK